MTYRIELRPAAVRELAKVDMPRRRQLARKIDGPGITGKQQQHRRRQARNIVEYVVAAIQAHRAGQLAPSLLPGTPLLLETA